MTTSRIRLYNPTHQVKPDPSSFFQHRQLPDVRGKSILILDNAWWVWEQSLPTLTEALAERYGVKETSIYQVPRSGSPPPSEMEKMANEVDGAIVGLAYGAPELLGILEDAIQIARDGLPTVCLVGEDFLHMWNTYARSRKVTFPVVTIPSNPEALPVEDAIKMMEDAIDKIVDAFKRSPQAPDAEPATEPYTEVADSLDEINDTIYRLGWADGLPVVPPTEERVDRMIVGINRNADEVIGEMPPLRGLATPTNIAANAIMAGCLPEHMPLLMAQVRACRDIEISLPIGLMNTLGTLMCVVNGPVRKELDINCSQGLFGPGRRSNAALGRALQFMVRNIGGGTSKITRSNMSQPGCYTFCFGENEEESPWKPLHVERGFSPEASTVTITSVTSIIQVATYTFDWRTMLDVFAESSAYYGSNIILQGAGEVWVFITPHHARQFANQGLSKQDVKEYIWQKARFSKAPFPENLVPYPHHLLGNDEEIFVVASPDDIHVVVVGAPGLFYGVVMTSIPTPTGEKLVSTAAIT